MEKLAAAAVDARIAGGVWCTLPAARTRTRIIRQSKRGRYTAEALTHKQTLTHRADSHSGGGDQMVFAHNSYQWGIVNL